MATAGSSSRETVSFRNRVTLTFDPLTSTLMQYNLVTQQLCHYPFGVNRPIDSIPGVYKVRLCIARINHYGD